MISEELLSALVCPECRKELTYDRQAETLKCSLCRRVYPIRDGFPVLLKDQAKKEE